MFKLSYSNYILNKKMCSLAMLLELTGQPSNMKAWIVFLKIGDNSIRIVWSMTACSIIRAKVKSGLNHFRVLCLSGTKRINYGHNLCIS